MCLGSASSVVFLGSGVYVVMLMVMSCSVIVSGFVLMFVVYLVLLNGVCFLSLGVYLYIVVDSR